MRLIPDSGTLMLRGAAQWQACALHDTVRVDDVVALASDPAPAPPGLGDAPFAGGFAGMAFDPRCRLFHPRPEDGAIETVLWAKTSSLGVHDAPATPFPISGASLPRRPLALACDDQALLYVADPDAKTVWLVDTWQGEVSRAIAFAAAPIDLSACGGAVFALLDDGSTWQLAACDEPRRTPWPAIAGAGRLAVTPTAAGGLLAWVLLDPGQVGAKLWALHLNRGLAAPFCTDVVAEPEEADAGALVTLAQRPGEEFLRMRLAGNQPAAQPSLSAPNYDGRGIALAPDGRISYWTARGLRQAAPAKRHYRPDGRVFGFALDSGLDRNRWGRVRVEACLPAGTQLRMIAFTRDAIDFADPIDGLGAGTAVPVLSQAAWDAFDGESRGLFRDPSQRPLSPVAADGFAHYDAPVLADPGRYLWLVFEFTGTRSKSPRLRAVDVEYPGHPLLQSLPRTLWREPAAQAFLFRYLMPLAAMLSEWRDVSATRHRLLDARIAPTEALGWLAGFVGLALDPCWPESVQRRMILQAAPLFRTRGTLASLQAMLQTLTGAEVVIIENFRLRGGGVVGNPQAQASQAVLGYGYRVGGLIGEPGDQPLADAPEVEFDDFAHRFSVTVVAALSDAQLACVLRLIEVHKPAHTDFTLCTACAGIRAGVGANVGISSVIGKSAGFEVAVLGDAGLDQGYTLGRPTIQEGVG
jgi:phage tail-like protein